MALINTTTTGIQGTTIYGDGQGDLTIQKDGATIAKVTAAPAFSVYQTTAQTLSSATLTKITFDTEEYDTNSNFASSRFTPTVAGYYLVSGHAQPNATYTAGVQAIYKNGSLYRYGSYNANASGVAQGAMTCLVYCNGSTDYIEFYASFTSGQDTAGVSNSGTFAFTWFQGHLARSA
jgi:hypothetical protein